MTGRSDARPAAIMVALAMLFVGAVAAYAVAPAPSAPLAPEPSPSPTATATPTPPEVTIDHETCCTQAARYLDASWTADRPVTAAEIELDLSPPFECVATIDEGGRSGRLGCAGLLPGAVEHVATLTVSAGEARAAVEHRFRTMGDRLEDVQWFTEFEQGVQPVACAAASCRIVQLYNTGTDPLTATEILELGRALNVSNDPGLDPVAIAAILERLDERNDYHYYRYDTREEATSAAVYWLLRSGKPVIAITLAGQHAPTIIGFEGTWGTGYDDPVNEVTGVVVQDPQRGDMRPETAHRRPDKYRTPEFQTGRLLGMDEWLGDEWWFGFPFFATITYAGAVYDIDRNDGAYPLPHWAGKFVLVVDDGDADWPPDREGRVDPSFP